MEVGETNWRGQEKGDNNLQQVALLAAKNQNCGNFSPRIKTIQVNKREVKLSCTN